MRVRLYLHFALWCALFAIFLWISVPMVGPAITENRFGPVETNRSIDDYLRVLAGIEHAADKLSDTFARLDKKGSLVIFVRKENSPSEFLGMIIGYLAWPREVQVFSVSGPTVEKELADIKPSSVAGVVFCSVNPPAWLQTRVRLGSNVVLVPITEAAP
jgi:hypothetical protein